MGSELLILHHGIAEVLSAVDECVYAVLDEGSICGEISFFLPSTRRIASIRSATYCEFLCLSKKDWDAISTGMDDLGKKIVSKVRKM